MKNYHIGLDIGTSSVGFAARDDDNNLIRVKGKNVIGARLFSEGKTAQERRISRTSRRRYNRRKWRLRLLDEIFHDAIVHKDAEFFNRLKQSSLSPKDERKQYFGSLLFPEVGDGDYFRDGNQTIYHLRHRLMTQDEKADIREVYLALRHIIKYRGNFLDDTPVSSFEASDLKLASFVPTLNDLFETINVNYELSIDNVNQIENILLNNKLRNSDKSKQLTDLIAEPVTNIDDKSLKKQFDKERKDISKEIAKAVVGSKMNVNKLLSFESSDGSKISFSFSDASSEDKMLELSDILDDSRMNILNVLKVIYSRVRLNQIIPSGMGLSESMIAAYDLHKQQLKDLKTLLDVVPFNEKYAVKIAYAAYIGNIDKQRFTKAEVKTIDKLRDKKSITSVLDFKSGHITNEELNNVIKEVIVDKYLNDETFEYHDIVEKINQDISNGNYLLKQRNNQNGNIPHQLHQMELDQIIEKQSKYYPFLGKLNPNSKRSHIAKYKISELVAFRVPYYVGPLITPEEQEKTSGASFAWMKRKEDGAITPWNFEKMVDKESTASRFIKRLTVKDTYLLNEDVLPDNSLLYEKFKVLNELNVVKANNKRLTVEEKQGAFDNLFKQMKTVTAKRLKNYLVSNHNHINSVKITGLSDGEKFNNSLSVYIDFKKIFGDKIDDSKLFDDFENIIEWSTVFEDRDIFEEKVRKDISWISESEINAVVSKRYSGWGRLSKKLLNGITNDEGRNIIDELWEESETFMEAVSKPEVKEKIDEINSNFIKNTDIESVLADAYTSPQNKKAIRETYKLVKDIQKAMGGQAPSSISIEFTRNPQDKGELTRSRHSEIAKKYKELSKEVSKKLNDELKSKKNSMDVDKYYLYFMQMGIDLYDGTSIDIDDLNNYQIDHIVPQSFYKDDSFDNRVLTHYSNNQKKGNNTPLNGLNIDSNTREVWNHLIGLGLITKRKYNNLTLKGMDQLSKYTKHGFIRRQLVETSQVIKLVANILSDEYSKDDTKIIEVKAKLNSQIRQVFNLYKIRELNDYHHALDAYLTTFIGGYLYNRYPNLRNMFVYGDFKKFSAKIDNLETFNFLHDITNPSDKFEDRIIDEKSGEVILDRRHAIETIKKIYQYNYMLITREVSTKNGQLSDQTVYSARRINKVNSPIPVKKDSNPELYGFRTGNVDHHMVIVKYLNKDKYDYKIIGIPLRFVQVLKNSNDNTEYKNILNKIVQSKLKGKSTDFRVILDNVMYGQLIQDGGQKFTLGSSTYKYNAKQLVINMDDIRILVDNRYFNSLSDDDASGEFIKIYNEILKVINARFDLFDINKFREKLNNGKEYFENLSIDEKNQVLLKMLSGLHCGSANVPIKELGLTTPLGKLQIPSGIVLSEDAIVIYQSPSGLFERKIRLKDI
ncbi:CRISPR-associated protein, Csn1 family [Apilactobacillus kunkeei]|uniref:type II CRISPR RNA-guided endonuclease Cas9 n=1 Tax=Apilactobacillus kunkeei TaxID=148814 RepID=UPI0006DA6324|nr:type II CRISPR RNA-guided endonuclease Cas9 [Apilactobacillus kunkeei]KPN82435.1 CRISPR-associated protein, Csn1 family [Apilactobacillus kunkeei]